MCQCAQIPTLLLQRYTRPVATERGSAMSRPNNHPISRRRWLVLLAILVVGFALAIVAAVVGWVGYLIPMAVLLGAGLVVLLQLVKRVPGGHDISDWWQ